MAKKRILPDPIWSESPEQCALCGYNLAGHAAPGRCPECGTAFSARQLTLHGVPERRSGGSPLRRSLWAVLLIGAVVYFESIAFLIFRQRLVALLGLICIFAGLIGLLLTSRRERRGAERFVLTLHGLVRLPLLTDDAAQAHDSVVIPWTAAASFELRRVSGFWRRLRIRGPRGERTKGALIFDAGIRCPDEMVGQLHDALREFIEEGKAAPTSSSDLKV